MLIRPFDPHDEAQHAQAVRLLADNFACWSDIENARKELDECRADGNILLIALEGGHVAGMIGANPHYGGNVWELHPLVTDAAMRLRGIGRMLVDALEAEAAARGGITIYLGTDDEDGATTLSGVDVYDDPCGKMRGIRNLHGHPYEFYQKCGYAIVGVVPDANGYGKPDIMMAKRIRKE